MFSVVRRPKLNKNVATLSGGETVLFFGPSWKQTEEDEVTKTNRRMIQNFREADPNATRIKIIYLTLEEEKSLQDEDKESAHKENVSLLGSAPPMGTAYPPAPADFDAFICAYFQNILHSRMLTDVTHVIGHSAVAANALHNMTHALQSIHQTKPKRILCTKEEPEEKLRECFQLADTLLYTGEDNEMQNELEKDFPSAAIFPFNTQAETSQAGTGILHAISGGLTFMQTRLSNSQIGNSQKKSVGL